MPGAVPIPSKRESLLLKEFKVKNEVDSLLLNK